MPAWLNEHATAEWRSIVPHLLRLGLLTQIDGAALAAYCVNRARWLAAEHEVARRGEFIDELIDDEPDRSSKRGRKHVVLVRRIENPAIRTADRAMKLMNRFGVEFGLTPSSRSRLSISHNGDKPADPADKYFSGDQGSGHKVQ